MTFTWHVHCDRCTAAAIGDELHCQTWVAAHACPQTPRDTRAETQPTTTKENPA